MWKFRTMITGAETLRNQLDESNEIDGPVFKMEHDPRVTPLGRFLRITSILQRFQHIDQGTMRKQSGRADGLFRQPKKPSLVRRINFLGNAPATWHRTQFRVGIR
jgi:hypothetical protein